MVVGRLYLAFGARPMFRCELLASGRVYVWFPLSWMAWNHHEPAVSETNPGGLNSLSQFEKNRGLIRAQVRIGAIRLYMQIGNGCLFFAGGTSLSKQPQVGRSFLVKLDLREMIFKKKWAIPKRTICIRSIHSDLSRGHPKLYGFVRESSQKGPLIQVCKLFQFTHIFDLGHMFHAFQIQFVQPPPCFLSVFQASEDEDRRSSAKSWTCGLYGDECFRESKGFLIQELCNTKISGSCGQRFSLGKLLWMTHMRL